MSTPYSNSQIPNPGFRVSSFLILICSFLILLAACGRKTDSSEDTLIPPPPINALVLRNLASEFPGEIRTTQYADQVQLVIFFQSDNAACRGALPEWSALQKEFQSRGFTLIGILTDNRIPEAITAELASLDLSWPVGLADAPIIAAFGGPEAIHAIPTAFLLSRDGALVRTYAGFEPFSHIREDIDLLLNGQELPDRNPKVIAPEDNDA